MEYLYRLHQLLSDEGEVFIEVPNETPETVEKIVKGESPGTAHLYFYDQESLIACIERSGLFDILSTGYAGISFGDLKAKKPLKNYYTSAQSNLCWLRLLIKKKAVTYVKYAKRNQLTQNNLLLKEQALIKLSEEKRVLTSEIASLKREVGENATGKSIDN